MSDSKYLSAQGLSYAGTLPKIKKSKEQLKPIYEAITNAIEAIILTGTGLKQGQISVTLKHRKNLFSDQNQEFEFDSLSIEDNGVGFTNAEFNRLETLNDTSKKFSNKGSGRIQYLHYFDKTEYISVFKDLTSSTGFKQRTFTLSKSEAFLKQNAIIREEEIKEVEAKNPRTELIFRTPLEEQDIEFYRDLKVEDLKARIISRYLEYFCENNESLPSFKLYHYVDDLLSSELEITASDIPKKDSEKKFTIFYSKLTTDGKTVEKTINSEEFLLKAFKISKSQIESNGLMLTSKGEIAKSLKLDGLKPEDHIDGNRYLFLVSSNYITAKDGDTRGTLSIPTLEEFKRNPGATELLFQQEEILLDDIKDKANEVITATYPEIKTKIDEKAKELDKLEKMFLLSPGSIRDAKIKLNDSEEKILEKVYKVDATIAAKKDAEIKKRVDALDQLNPSVADFREKLEIEIDELTRAIPLQNRTALTHYIARRKLILDLFDKVINKKLVFQDPLKKEHDESLLHNILFQQGGDDPSKSDLWMLNEDFIYFTGFSEKQLSKITLNGKKIFKATFSDEEERYLKSLGENRKIKRPDILLFPDEGKCIIIELKDPEVNASEHLTQIDFYASLIRNYTEDEFQIKTYYGYLIGENIEPRDVMGRVSRYEHSYNFDYLFRPSENVNGFDGRANGSIYTEVIKYSTLHARASLRNKIFLDKLK